MTRLDLRRRQTALGLNTQWIKPTLASFGVGVLVGAVYWALRLETPAPIPIALLGLLGVLVGETGVKALIGRVRGCGLRE